MGNETSLAPSSVATGEYFNSDQVELIKRQIAKGCSDDELKLFMYQCARTGLDPFSRQIYAIQRYEWDDKAGRSVTKMSIQTGIDGFRLIAERTGKYAPGPDCDYEYSGSPKDGELVKATAHVMKLAGGTWHKVSASAHMGEYVQTKKDGTPTKMWKEKPHIMLGKCAEALALRKAFPAEMSGLYTSDEMGNQEEAQVVAEPHPMVEAAKATFPKAVARPAPNAEPISSSETELATAGDATESIDLVPCWRLIEEGSKKALTYRSEFVPMDNQPKRTEAQNKLIHVLLAKRGLSDEDRRAKLRERFNKESTAELSMEEAGRLIDMLEDSIKRFGSKAETQAAKEKRQEKKADRAMKEIGEYLESLPEPSND